MRITDLHIDGFGVWHDLTLRSLSPGMTAFYGPNEAGKTTLLQFLRSVLYGISPARRKQYLPPLVGGLPGGWLNVDGESGEVKIQRIADRGPNDVGKVTIFSSDGVEHGDRQLLEALEHVDEMTYNNVFAVGLREIQELGTLSGTAAAQWLYRLASGVDRVSLYDVIHLLRGSLARLLNVTDTKSTIRELVECREVLQGELHELIEKGRRWAQSAVKLRELADEIQAMQDESKQLGKQGRHLETAINLKPLWIQRDRLDKQIASYDHLVPLSDSAIAELEELNERVAAHQRDRDLCKAQRKQLRSEVESLDINQMLEANTSRLLGLEEQQEWIGGLERQMEELDEEVVALENRCEAEQAQLVNRWLADGVHAGPVSPDLLDQLQPQARAIEAAKTLVDQAEAELAARHHSERNYRDQLTTAVANSDKRGLPGDIEATSNLVATLRHRLEVEQRVGQARSELRNLEQKNYEFAESQLLSLNWFSFLLIAFVVSCVLAGSRLIGWLPEGSMLHLLAGWVGPLGIVGCIAAVVGKFVREWMAGDRLDTWELEREHAEESLKQAQEEQEKLTQEVPLAKGAAALKLEQAEHHLSELEKTLPVENERRAAQQEIVTAESRLEQSRKKHEVALSNWQNKVRSLGLAERVRPVDIDGINRNSRKLEDLQERKAGRREERDRRHREFETVVKRIRNLAVEASLVEEAMTPLEQLAHMLEVHRVQQGQLKQRDALKVRARKLKTDETRHARVVLELTGRREAMFKQWCVEDEPALRQLADKHAKSDKLREKRKGICREIVAAIGRRGSEKDFAASMVPEKMESLQQDLQAITARDEQIGVELKELLERRGQLVEQQRHRAEDRSLAYKQLEIDEIDQQIYRARKAWRERAVVYGMLERIQEEYEKNRQPETLLEASGYLRKLTDGRYTRVWTPLAMDVLFVETADGESLPVEVLSTGTREQLFVSLRMAMVAMYGRRGIQLPMILDDVLVNFDADRTRTAVEVLHDFSKQGHQLLFFTCHKHVWRMFQEIKADARDLPDRFETGTSVEPVEASVIQPQNIDSEPWEVDEEGKEIGESRFERVPEHAQERKIRQIEVVQSPEPLPDYSYEETLDLEPPPVTEFEYEFEDPDQPDSQPTEVEYTWGSRLDVASTRVPPTPQEEHAVGQNVDPMVQPLAGVGASVGRDQQGSPDSDR